MFEVRSNYFERAVVRPLDGDFSPSETPGAVRSILDWNDGEVPRATAIARYTPGTSIPSPPEGIGEEIFVLKGSYEDALGVYSAGTYLRNPSGTSHNARTVDGCELFVKPARFDSEERDRIVVDTRKSAWLPGLIEGLSVLPLYAHGTESVALVRWLPHTSFMPHTHFGGEEILVLLGVFEDEHGAYPAGTWVRSPSMSRHQPFTVEGCVILVRVGHLPG